MLVPNPRTRSQPTTLTLQYGGDTCLRDALTLIGSTQAAPMPCRQGPPETLTKGVEVTTDYAISIIAVAACVVALEACILAHYLAA
jgi:hypothetical protein